MSIQLFTVNNASIILLLNIILYIQIYCVCVSWGDGGVMFGILRYDKLYDDFFIKKLLKEKENEWSF